MKLVLTFKFRNMIKKPNEYWMTSNISFHYTQPITTQLQNSCVYCQKRNQNQARKGR